MRTLVAAAVILFAMSSACAAAETREQAAARHARVAERRAGVGVICHRGAAEFAHENTLDAYRATFELGGDGNEVDIRRTSDGVLVCFHDDMLDMLLAGAYGDVADHTWAELQTFPFRDPGRMAATCRIPTLAEALTLHRDHGGLLVLDVKRPGLDDAIARLLEQTDMWDHVIGVNAETAPKLAKDPRVKPRRWKAGLFQDRSDVFADKVEAAVKLPGDDLIVDDPRAAVVALGRKLGTPSPKSAKAAVVAPGAPPVPRLLEVLRDDVGWDRVADGADEKAASARRIVERARAADQVLQAGAATPEVSQALADAVRHRSLHKDWIYHGLDGATALRALILLRAPGASNLARDVIWRVDPALEAVHDPRWKNPPAWADWRIKQVPFSAFAQHPGDADAAQVCRDYLALSDEQAREIGIPMFEPAAKALVELTRDERAAVELMKHRRQDVRGRAILVCLAHADEPWALAALKAGAPHALAYVVPQ